MTLVKEKSDSDYLEWSAEDEIQLFFAMDGLRPVGINKHFVIACITERLSKALNREVSSEMIWSHLKTMYNLKALDEQDELLLPTEETDFSLPEAEYSSVMKRKSVEEPASAEETKKIDAKPEPIVKPAKEKEIPEKEKPVEKETKSSKAKNENSESTPKRPQKRTRGSMSLEPNASSPASTPPNIHSSKRRRI
ncbi:MRG/MORF4L-binding protein [Armigeres subalbatus]|uniref:MRG/MORF4L-binding protein n=1 Tax=Armigeres subalbatus TaxID=124917 RepID=UPI002ED21E34